MTKPKGNPTFEIIKGYEVLAYGVKGKKLSEFTRSSKPKTQLPKSGDVFGELRVIESLGVASGSHQPSELYGCVCSCGRKVAIPQRGILGGTISCGCQVNRGGRLPDGEAAKNETKGSYRSGAKNRGLNFSLSDEDMEILFKSNCYYCGKPPSNSKRSSGSRRTGAFVYNGIDRIENSIGYTPNNCVACCSECNYAKSDRNVNEFLSWARSVAANAPKYVF